MKPENEQMLNEIIDELGLFFSHSTEEDIKQIVDMYCKKQLLLHNVSQQRELLREYNKFNNEKMIYGGSLTDFEIDCFESRNCG